ncbi:MAG TPA: hypothetical protein VHW23_18060 [Kofleriaceae bacterium]|nr:hypothetical protein [Kofleriaceae bacterium]
MKTPSSHNPAIADNELTGDELDQVSGGLSFLGGFGTAGIGGSVGPIGAGVGIAHGGPNGDLYGTVYGGGSPLGGVPQVTGGAQANLAFGFGDHNFDDVVTGHSTNVEFGFGTVSYNENGFTVGLGPSGFGVSHSETTNLTQSAIPPEVQENLNALNGPDHSADLNQPPPQLTDWSNSFGDHELAGDHGAQGATGDHGAQDAAGDHGTQDAAGDHGTQDSGDHGTQDSGDHGTQDSGDHGTQDAAGDHGTQDTGSGVDHSGDSGTDNGGIADQGGSTFGNDFGDSNSGSGDFSGGGDFGGGDFGGGDFA